MTNANAILNLIHRWKFSMHELLGYGSTFTHKGKEVTITGKRYNCKKDKDLNVLQQAHINGKIDLYEPIEAYSQEYKTVYDETSGDFIEACPVGDPKRNDLPPVYMQWKQDYKARYL